MSVPEPEYAEVFRTQSRLDLNAVADELRRAGVPIRLEREVEPGSGSFDLLPSQDEQPGGLLRIRVAEEYAEMARTILRQWGQGPSAATAPSFGLEPVRIASFPGILGAIGLSALLLALLVAANVVFIVALMVAGFGVDGFKAYVMEATAVINVACFLIVAALGVALAKAPAREFFPFSRFRWTTLAPLLLAVEGLVILTSEMDNVFQHFFPMPDWIRDSMIGMLDGGWASFVTLVIVAPVTEELFFRGLILRGLLKRYSTVTAIVWTSILFGVIHMNPYQIGGAFVVGIFLGWLMLRTGSLWPCLLAHSLFNLHALVLPVLAERFGFHVQGFTVPAAEMGMTLQPLWFDAIGVVLAVVGLWALLVITRDSSAESTDSSAPTAQGRPESADDGPYRSPGPYSA